MAFNWLKKLIKYLFSRLHRDAIYERKEERLERKGRRDFLNEIIDTNRVSRDIKNLARNRSKSSDIIDKLDNQIEVVSNQLTKSGNTPQIKSASEQMADEMKSLLGLLEVETGFLERWIKDGKNLIGKIADEDKKLREELKLINRQRQNLRRSLQKGEKLDQNKKGAIIQKKEELTRKIRAINAVLKEENEKTGGVHSDNLEAVKELRGREKGISEKLLAENKDVSKKKEAMNQVKTFLEDCRKFNGKSRAREQIAFDQIRSNKKFLAEKAAIYDEIKILDKEYDQLLIDEEIEVQEAA